MWGVEWSEFGALPSARLSYIEGASPWAYRGVNTMSSQATYKMMEERAIELTVP